jgi:hypothetical protein
MAILSQSELVSAFSDWMENTNCGSRVREGWNPIVRDFLQAVKDVLEANSIALNQFFLDKIQEKTDGLRITWRLDNAGMTSEQEQSLRDEIASLEAQAKQIASETCEECGEFGEEVWAGSSLLTICSECELDRKELLGPIPG